MRFENNKNYKVVKNGSSLLGLPTQNEKQELITLNVGDILMYVGHEYAGIDYDVVQPPYFRFQDKDYIFQPSSFSGLVPLGYLEPENNQT